jgi:hypothetical protein
MLNVHRFGAFALSRALTRPIWRRKKKPRKRGALKFLLASLSVNNWAVLVSIAPPMARSQPIFVQPVELKAGRLRPLREVDAVVER